VVAAVVAAAGLRRGIHAAPDTQAGPTASADQAAAADRAAEAGHN
jgi:hypothetical protein